MKILFLISSLSAGGAERVVSNLSNYWASTNNHELTIMTIANNKDFYFLNPAIKRIVLNADIDSKTFISGLFNNILRIVKIRKNLKLIKPEIVIGMTYSCAIPLIIASIGLKCKIIVSERTFPPIQNIGSIWNILRWILYPFASKVVVLTTENKNWFNKNIPRANIEIIPNPAIFPLNNENGDIKRINEYISKSDNIILSVGRMDEGKQFNKLIFTFFKLLPTLKNWKLVIVGSGPRYSSLVGLVSRLKLTEHVVFPGQCNNIGDWYARASIYVMSSKYEGFPNSLVEALAYGCPSISYDCDTGPRDIINNYQNGILVSPVGDIPALTFAVKTLIEDFELREKFSQNAINIRKNLSIEFVAKLWEKLF